MHGEGSENAVGASARADPGGRASRCNLPDPCCPQLRRCQIERLDPVQGYCVLAHAPGWFRVPSIEEYREYCTTPRFAACGWLTGDHTPDIPIAGRPGQRGAAPGT